MNEHLLILTEKDSEGRFQVRLRGIFECVSESEIGACDHDRSYVLRVDSITSVEKALQRQFKAYDVYQRNHPSLWRRAREGSAIKTNSHPFLPEDESGVSLARRMVEFIYQNRLGLGDDGKWQLWTCRELLLKRGGINLSDLAHQEQRQSVPVKALPDADYTDELGSFRFPSTSCLYGVSQPLSQLRGAVKFRKLFIQDGAGVYVAFHDDEVLYVGMSQRFSQRLSNADGHHKLKWVLACHPTARVAVIHYPFWKLPLLKDAVTSDEKDAAWGRVRELLFGLERACIGYYKPRYNGVLTEDDLAQDEPLPMMFAAPPAQVAFMLGA